MKTKFVFFTKNRSVIGQPQELFAKVKSNIGIFEKVLPIKVVLGDNGVVRNDDEVRQAICEFKRKVIKETTSSRT